MANKNSFVGGALRLGGGQVVSQACSFVRNIIMARLISPDNFGIAATFAMTYALMEMASNVSVQSLLVQASDGDENRFQSTGHTLLIGRGILNASLLLVLALPLSSLFGVPQARWAFYCVAVIPILNGFVHLDLSRFQRHMRFAPFVLVDALSSLMVCLLAWPLAAWLRDYSAMLWLLVLQAALYTAASQIVAERRYECSWDRKYASRYLAFGWPLLVNGLLMYGILQGDRFVIGASRRLFSHSIYTLTDLAVYSVAFAVTMAPSSLFVSVTSSLFLPLMSRSQESRTQFDRRYAACSQLAACCGLAIAVPSILVCPYLITKIYGNKYAAAGALVGWLGAMWGVRIFRASPTLAAMAVGDTRNSMVANIVRSSAIMGMIVVAASGQSLAWIAICSLGGEVLATAACIWRLRLQHQIRPALALTPGAVLIVGTVGAAVASVMSNRAPILFGMVLLVWLCCAGLMLLIFPEFRRNLRATLLPQRSPAVAGI
jgi:O-antigen/teichoic acid export membrane protein